MPNTPADLPPCTCDLAANRRYHSDECQAAWDALTDALLAAEAADAQADAAETVDEIDAAVTALRAVPAITGRNSRPVILALLRRRVALTVQGERIGVINEIHEPSVNGPCPADWNF